MPGTAPWSGRDGRGHPRSGEGLTMSHNEGVTMDDDATLEELRALLTRMDPVPDRLDEAARAAFTWRTIDAELAELMADSADALDESALALRSATVGPRMLSFE